MISFIGATHPGQREHNEDCYAANRELGLALVADGMGGYACGEVASELVKTTIEQAIANNQSLHEAISTAHSVVTAVAAEDASKKGMGSTAIAAKFNGLAYEVAWVGDSRAYLWDGAVSLKQLSRDHSYVELLLSSGAINYEEALSHPNRNLITQAVGAAGEQGLKIDTVQGRLLPGQQLLLCSDGLVDEVVDLDIARLLAEASNPEGAVDSLVQAAIANGGRDNITVVLVTVDPGYKSDEPAVEPDSVRAVSLENAADATTATDNVRDQSSNQQPRRTIFDISESHRSVLIVVGVLLASLLSYIYYF